MNDLSGRVAIVTGAGRGLGRAMALALAQAGVTVIATAAREVAEIEAVAATERVLAVQADVTRPDDCAQVVEMAQARFGPAGRAGQ